MKIYQTVQNVLVGTQTGRQTCDLISLLSFLESRLKRSLCHRSFTPSHRVHCLSSFFSNSRVTLSSLCASVAVKNLFRQFFFLYWEGGGTQLIFTGTPLAKISLFAISVYSQTRKGIEKRQGRLFPEVVWRKTKLSVRRDSRPRNSSR
jgi:hypothetical protein